MESHRDRKKPAKKHEKNFYFFHVFVLVWYKDYNGGKINRLNLPLTERIFKGEVK
jgi:hypothetical protein